MDKSNISKIDIHPLDKYIKWMANKYIMLSIFIFILIFGVISSYIYDNSIMIVKSGSLGAMIGTLLTLSPMFSSGIYLSKPDSARFARLDKEDKIIKTTDEGRKASSGVACGVVLIIISTFISTFGDLITLH